MPNCYRYLYKKKIRWVNTKISLKLWSWLLSEKAYQTTLVLSINIIAPQNLSTGYAAFGIVEFRSNWIYSINSVLYILMPPKTCVCTNLVLIWQKFTARHVKQWWAITSEAESHLRTWAVPLTGAVKWISCWSLVELFLYMKRNIK